MISGDHIRKTIADLLPETQQLLVDLIRFPSTPGNEHEAMCFLHERFGSLQVDLEKVQLSDELKNDPDYSDPVPDIRYDGRFNLRIARKGTGGGKTLLFNAHVDVVPPSEGMQNAYEARVEDGTVYARGACDDKGQVASIFLILKTLETLGVQPAGDVIAHLVVEEENGGNGSLAMVRRGEQADGCIVMESSGGKLLTSIRGAVWFRLVLFGKAGHSGQAAQTRSALLMARDAIGVLERYHAQLLENSRGIPLFNEHPNPMPITFGKMQAGNWPAAAPSRATLEGVLGLLPNKTRDEVCDEMRQALLDSGLTTNDFELTFMYRHDSSVLDPSHELPTTILDAANAVDTPLSVAAMTASCDAWNYNNQLNIPTVVYGPGTLAVAHSKDECIAMADIAKAAEVLIHTILNYCKATS